MIMDDPGPATFEADPLDEYRLTFGVRDVLSRSGRRTLMTMRCFEEEKMYGTIVWLGEHQELWPEWRTIAEAEGGNPLSARIAALMAEDSLRRFGSSKYLCEMCLGATITRGAGRTEIAISVMLSTRSLPITTHAFNDVRGRDAFMASLASGYRAEGSMAFAEMALLQGRGALARKLDELEHELLAADARNVH